MKTIIATRHAETLEAEFGQLDFERELSANGIIEAQLMGQKFLQKNIIVDAITCSTAARAKATCLIISNAFNFEIKKINWEEKLYNAPSFKIEDVLAETDDEITTLLFVAHNFGITQWAHEQIGNIMDAMPTAAMLAINIETTSWANISTATKTLLFYDFPKNGMIY
jgi:phosphohistidine phosphatase